VGDGYGRDVGQAFKCNIPKHGYIQELEDQSSNKFRLKDVTQGDPVQESEKRFQSGTYQRGILEKESNILLSWIIIYFLTNIYKNLQRLLLVSCPARTGRAERHQKTASTWYPSNAWP